MRTMARWPDGNSSVVTTVQYSPIIQARDTAHVFGTPKSSAMITVGELSGSIASRANDRNRRNPVTLMRHCE